jgi:hypothetical protein
MHNPMPFSPGPWNCLSSAVVAITLPIVAIALPSLAQPTVPLVQFSDTQDHWAAACIERMGGSDTMQGYGDGRFLPDNTINRAEFAALMVQAFGTAEKVRHAPNFTDLPASFWATAAIQQAYERGFLEGYPNDQFRPFQAISRAQAIAIFAKAQQLSSEGNTDAILNRYFSDQSGIPGYARGAIAAAAAASLVVNYPTVDQVRPADSITRGEVAAILCQASRDGSDYRYNVPDEYVVSVQFCPSDPNVRHYDADGFAVVFAGADEFGYGKFGMVDRSGNWVIAPDYGELHPFSDGLALGFPPPFNYYDQSYRFIDQQGQVAFSRPIEGQIRDFSEGLAAFSNRRGQWGFLDKTGAVAIAAQYDDAQPFVNGLARVQQNGRYGFINSSGQVVIPIQYEATHETFQEGLVGARLQTSAPWGYLTVDGAWAIAPQFQAVEAFAQGLARVTERDQTREHWQVINQAGQPVNAPTPTDSGCLPL